jgi:probable phosphomutase (TIGR03848 family)
VTTLVLVRHGLTPTTGERLGGRTETSLSEEGLRQAEAVAERLASLEVVAVHASPIVRAMETARPIAKRHGLRVRRSTGVQEVDYGEWTDEPLEVVREEPLWRMIQQAPSRVSFPEGEALRAMQARAIAAVDAIVARRPGDDTVVVVSHADVIKAILAHHLGVHLDLFQRIVISPASISTLVVPADAPPAALCLNDRSHLTEVGR